MDELNNYLKEFDLTVNDLTQEEITQLKGQLEAEKEGALILDGFDPFEATTRKLKRELKK